MDSDIAMVASPMFANSANYGAPHGTVAGDPGDPRKATASPAAEPTERAAAGATGNVATQG